MKNLILLTLATLVISFNAKSTTCVSLGNGVWDNPATWSCGAVPAPGDTIIINVGDTVTLQTTEILYGAPMVIIVNGYFLFNMPAAKLHLECGSEVVVNATGEIASSGIGTPSHNIKICGNEVWQGFDGPLLGPVILTGPLPIELIGFDATQSNYIVTLNWSTATEYNNDFFTIEGSLNGFEWDVLLTVDGAGNSSQQLDYTAEYNNRDSKYGYFRLKQTDYNGGYSYSDIVSVQNRMTADFNVYPNPMTGSTIKIEINDLDNYDVVISSLSGRQIYFESGLNAKELWISDLEMEPGMYIVAVISGDQRLAKKIIKN